MNDQLTLFEKQDLIKINTDFNGIETVNARDLHEFVESKQEFSNWIKSRIRDYGFKKDNDFIVFDKIIINSNGGRPATEYHLTIDMAKHLAMTERNDKGMQIRQWFIDRERKLKTHEMSISNPPLLPNFNDPVAAARAWADAKESELKAKLELKEAQPKIEFYEKVGNAEGLHTMAEAAKLLGTGRNRLFDMLRTNSILRHNNEPYQVYINSGYFEVKDITYNSGGQDYVKPQTFVTPKGLQWIGNTFFN